MTANGDVASGSAKEDEPGRLIVGVDFGGQYLTG